MLRLLFRAAAAPAPTWVMPPAEAAEVAEAEARKATCACAPKASRHNPQIIVILIKITRLG
jgi:hypothetical protein